MMGPMQVPMYTGYAWHAVALVLVSAYTAAAGYAASASLAPAPAAAALLGGVFCSLALLSGAVAPTLRTMYASGRLFYGLSGERFNFYSQHHLSATATSRSEMIGPSISRIYRTDLIAIKVLG